MEVLGCDNCGDTYFNTDESTTFQYEAPLNEETITFGYDDSTTITLFGAEADDTVCYTSMANSCATEVRVIAVLSQTNLDTTIDGIAGL